jgi:hypothetical protein
MRSKLIACGLLAAGLLLVAGCKVNALTTVKSDGSGEFRAEMGFTADEVKQFGQLSSGGSPDICNTAQQGGQSMPPGTTFKQEQRGDETWCVAAAPFASMDELRKMYTDMSNVTVQQLDIKAGKFTYDVSLDLSQEGSAPAPVQATWQLTMPGAVGANNADKADGSTLTWNLTPGKTVELKAESGLGGLSLPFSVPGWAYAVGVGCLCLVVLIVIVVVVVVLLRRRKTPPASGSPS